MASVTEWIKSNVVRPSLFLCVCDGFQVLNLRTDELLMGFKQQVGVTSLAFRTDAAAANLPLLASSGADGRVCLWDLKERRLHHTMEAHEGNISGLQFLPRLVRRDAHRGHAVYRWSFTAIQYKCIVT